MSDINEKIVPMAQSPPVKRKPKNCPPGLEYLLNVNQLLIKQKVEVLETLTGFETNNQYDVQNSLGQNMFVASEDTDCCTRNCCGKNRAFNLRILDYTQREVIHLSRPLRCECPFCCPCCLQYIKVEAPPGELIGHVIQDCSCITPYFHIEDAKGKRQIDIAGPCCTQSVLCSDADFDVVVQHPYARVGKITKQWSGLLREGFTDADIYGVIFPMDLDVRVKTCLLAATFLIDYMFFEHTELIGGEKKDPVKMLTGQQQGTLPGIVQSL